MRAGPGTGQPVTHVLRARQAVEVLDCATPRWCRVQSAGRLGWVNRKYLRAAPKAPRSTLSTMSASKGTHPHGALSLPAPCAEAPASPSSAQPAPAGPTWPPASGVPRSPGRSAQTAIASTRRAPSPSS
ncbi:SH3 domain-containing protein [Oceanicola sp. 502str15]|uniref:SH3 domain-containing protein n=1 Tax=Oceanicola sp. 502str15 TaxID=2696061 RepID=UPI003531D1F4